MSAEIKNFKEFITPFLKNGQTFVSYECKKLLASGENYGSVMLQVQMKVLNKDGKEETIHYVAKTCPPPGLMWELFNTKVTFKLEISFYRNIALLLNQFAEERGVCSFMSIVPENPCARISLDPNSDVVDENAVLLLENLKEQNYQTGDRFVGFDIETAKLLLTDLATLHGTPIAYRLLKPDEFKTKLLPYIPKVLFNVSDKFSDSLIKTSTRVASENPECARYLSKIEAALRSLNSGQNNPSKTNEMFMTLIHNDYWVNNTLIKYENGKPVKNKIVDFQIIKYGSLAHDVLFFLYTSVHLSVLESHADELFKFYYEKLMDTLVKLGCDISECTFESMMQDFAVIAKCSEFSHLLLLLRPILTLKGEFKELSHDTTEDDFDVPQESLHENYSKRVQFLVLDFAKRGWL